MKLHARTGRWNARVGADQRSLGYYATAAEAAYVRDVAAAWLSGGVAVPNGIDDALVPPIRKAELEESVRARLDGDRRGRPRPRRA